MSPRRRNRRRERRGIVCIERVDIYVDGRLVAAFAFPTFRGARYEARARVRQPPIPPMVTWFQERWNDMIARTP